MPSIVCHPIGGPVEFMDEAFPLVLCDAGSRRDEDEDDLVYLYDEDEGDLEEDRRRPRRVRRR